MRLKYIKQNKASGFTLIELLIAMVVFAIIVAAMYGVLINSNRNYAIQNEVVDAQNNLRAAVGLLSRELRMAGYNVTPGNVTPGFVTQPVGPTVASPLQFNTDLGLIEYGLDGTNLRRREPGGGFQTIAENIESFVIDYDDLPNVIFTIRAFTPNFDRNREATVTVKVRNPL